MSKTVMVSGGFDPLHVGHVRLLQAARALGDRLIVVVNNDNWLRQKKGWVFMSEDERVEIIEAIDVVDKVFLSLHSKEPTDMSVCMELHMLRPDIFANGGDRSPDDVPIPEAFVCKQRGIEVAYGVGGGKVQSSSHLVTSSEYINALIKAGFK